MKLLLLLLLSWEGTASLMSGPPQIDGGDEVYVEDEKPLTLTCRGSKPLLWKLTHDELDVANITNEKGTGSTPFVSTLHVDEMYHTDTGYHYCYYEGVTDFENDTQNADSTYIYVYGGSPFVKGDLGRKVVKVGDTLVVPCTTTHPNISVILKLNNEKITSEERVSFDPRKGFSVKNITSSDGGRYKCHNDAQELGTTVIVEEKIIANPSIHAGKNQHFVMGSNFSLQCKKIDPKGMDFSWSYPNMQANQNNQQEEEQSKDNMYLVSTLTVYNATLDDSGTYTCTISSPGWKSGNASMNITIKEEHAPFVSITSKVKTLVIEEGKNVTTWRAEVLYYPSDPIITYTNWRGQQLTKTDRITMEHDEYDGWSKLHIENITSSDFGNYTLTVTTRDGAAKNSSTVTLQVKNIPHMKLAGVPSSLLPEGKSLNVTCTAEGYPVPTVRLLFQDCSHGSNSCSPSLSEIQPEMESTTRPAPGNIVEKSVTFSPNTPGQLWCTGENTLGKDNNTADVIVSDISENFVLEHDGENGTTKVKNHQTISVVENDRFSLTCAASKFFFKSISFQHTLPDSSRPHNLPAGNTNLSWRVTKTVDKATKALGGEYECIAERHIGQQKTKRINITVLDEEEVRPGEKMNLINQTEMVTDKKPFSLNCNVTGMPEPSIQWLKDGKTLTRGSKFFDAKSMNFSSDMKVLMFNFVFKKHKGRYTCIAENRLNKFEGSLTITVADPAPGMSEGAKVGLAITCVFIALLFFIVAFLITRVKKEAHLKRELKRNSIYLFRRGNLGQLNPSCTTDQQADLLPYDHKWEVNREDITPGKQLGSGAFGRVFKATVSGLEGHAATTVAIKTCKSVGLDTAQLRSLSMELKIMMHLGKHLNIVNLMGANTADLEKGELWILVEYCQYGNLLDFMRRHRRTFINQIDADTGKIDYEKTVMEPFSPMSHASSPSYGPVFVHADADGYLAPKSPQLVLADPPPGHAAKRDHPSTASYCNMQGPESTVPGMPGAQQAHNPLYQAGVSLSVADSKEEPAKNEDFSEYHTPQDRDSSHLTPGPDYLQMTSDGTELGSQSTEHTTLMQQTSSPCPSDYCSMGAPVDSKGNAFTYEASSVPGATAHFSTSDLLSWGWQVAKGMDYLCSRKVLHGDLAARNLLLADNNVVKISDFGMSRDIYKANCYKKKKDGLMPVMWMPVEAIEDQTFSVQSDVWAFGVTLWEIFSLGTTPYPGMEYSPEFLQRLVEGYRMSCPKYANQEIYSIMMKCWKLQPMDRPSFSELVNYLGLMMPRYLKEEYLAKDETYKRMNEQRFKEEKDFLLAMASPEYEHMTRAEESAGDAQCLNVQLHSPCAVSYHLGNSQPSSPSPSSGSHYLSMQGSPASVQSPSSDVSPLPTESSRFNFPSNNNESTRLSSLPEEEETSSLVGDTRAQPPSEGYMPIHNKVDTPVAESRNAESGYANI